MADVLAHIVERKREHVAACKQRRSLASLLADVPSLPPARIDPGQLELAILNLAVNARDAMGGGGQLRIRLDDVEVAHAGDGLEPGRYIRLAVKDSGATVYETVALLPPPQAMSPAARALMELLDPPPGSAEVSR